MTPFFGGGYENECRLLYTTIADLKYRKSFCEYIVFFLVLRLTGAWRFEQYATFELVPTLQKWGHLWPEKKVSSNVPRTQYIAHRDLFGPKYHPPDQYC